MTENRLNLLTKLCTIQSSYTEDTEIMKFLKDYITNNLSLSYTEDDFGNIYVIKGEGKSGYKTMVSHTDTVHKIYNYRKVFCDNGYLFSMGCDKGKLLEQVGIGGDDKVGVFLCLCALEDFDNIKVVFFRFEESGCKGSKACNMSFFNDSNFIIQPDRKEYGDFIRKSKGIEMCSDEFINTVKPIYEKYNYSIVSGISTDVNQLKERDLKVCAINLGCGYYSPHSNNEVIYLPNVVACYMLITDIFNNHGDTKFEHDYVRPTYSYSSRSRFDNNTYSYYSSKSTKKEFSNKSSDNFFKQRLLSDLYHPLISTGDDIINKLSDGGFKFLWRIDGDKEVYYYTDTNPIIINDDIVYIPLEDLFYNIKENKYIKSIKDNVYLKQNLKLIDTDIEFVYSNLYDYWLKRNHAKWDDSLDTWIFKEDN